MLGAIYIYICSLERERERVMIINSLISGTRKKFNEVAFIVEINKRINNTTKSSYAVYAFFHRPIRSSFYWDSSFWHLFQDEMTKS